MQVVEGQYALNKALAEGVPHIGLAPGEYDLVLHRFQYEAPVLIEPADAQQQPVFERVKLNRCSNLVFRGFLFSGRPDQVAFDVADGSGIWAENCHFLGPATRFRNSRQDPSSGLAADFTDSSRSGIRDCIVERHEHAVSFRDCKRCAFSRNQVRHMVGDGVRMSGVQDQLVNANHFSNWLGAGWDVNHADMIQLWSVSTNKLTTRGLKILDNVLDSTGGMATQSIFLRYEDYRSRLVLHQGIEITGNLIKNGHVHGILVENTDGVVIRDNRLAFDREAYAMARIGGKRQSSAPQIALEGLARNAQVFDNIVEAAA